MGSLQISKTTDSPVFLETSCGYLLQELQMIWDEVGENQMEREKVLIDIEQECLEVYRRKVDNANMSRARLHQQLAEAQAGFTHLLLSLGVPLQRPDKMSGTLKEQLESISPALKEMQMRKEERMKQFRGVQTQIQKVSDEIAGRSEYSDASPSVVVNESDLSLKKLEEYQNELQTLIKKKSERLAKVEKYISTIQNLSTILGMDSSMIITKVHPSLNALSGLAKNIGDVILAKLDSTVQSLEAQKQSRLEKLHQLIQALKNLWNLMDTPYEDRERFSNVIRLASIPSTEISSPGTLTVDIIQQVEIEVNRLDQLKASKMKELFLKKQHELEEICHQSHMEILSRSEMESIMNQMNTGEIDHAALLASMDKQIYQAEEESSSRKPIMEKVEKWILARDEERWLEEYNKDDNRYSVRRGAHRNLKRAEHARVMVNKIPALVDSLIVKTKEWEDERRKTFFYDGVPLLAMLEEYNMLVKEKDVEKHRQREKKKVQSQEVSIEPGNSSVSRPSSSSRRLSDRSLNGSFGGSSPLNNRRYSMGTGMQQQQQFEHESIRSNSTPCIKQGKKDARGQQRTFTRNGFGLHTREDATTAVSGFSGPVSPYFDRVNY